MNTNLFSLEGKVALVTGASRGLGQAMAVGLAAAGADVAGLDVQPCSETSEQVHALGRRFVDVSCDLSKAGPDDISHVVKGIVDGLGSLDILLNNAGIIRRAPIFEFSEAYWDDVLQINLKAVFFVVSSGSATNGRARWRQNYQYCLDAFLPRRYFGAFLHSRQKWCGWGDQSLRQ